MNQPIIEPLEFLKFSNESLLIELKDVRVALLCFDRGTYKNIRSVIPGRRILGLTASGWLTETGILICGNFGIGAPAAVDLLEQLTAAGIRRIFTIGTAGALHNDFQAGEIVVCTGAFPDEGTSAHYIPTPGLARPSQKLLLETTHFLDAKEINHKPGLAWTTDAPFCETTGKLQHFTGLGADVVEMEASALYHVAAFRNVELLSLFVIGDSIAGGTWKPAFFDKKVRDKLLEISLLLVKFMGE